MNNCSNSGGHNLHVLKIANGAREQVGRPAPALVPPTCHYCHAFATFQRRRRCPTFLGATVTTKNRPMGAAMDGTAQVFGTIGLNGVWADFDLTLMTTIEID